MVDDLDAAWLRMVTLFIAKRDAMFEALGRHGLTPPHGHALSLLALGRRSARPSSSSRSTSAVM
jgi:hypothetical protein